MHHIVNRLMKDRNATYFLDPVDALSLGLKDYYDVIPNPMDLSTVKKKIPNYQTIEFFLEDLQLIWENCKKYNKESSVR